MATATAKPKVARVVSPTKGTRAEALGLIFTPMLARGEGFRHGAIGAPGYGKTFHVREVLQAALERDVTDLVLTHDTKGREPEFSGVLTVRTTDKWQSRPELEPRRHVVFRGDVQRDVVCPPEDVALLGKRLAQQAGLRLLLNIGELDTCLTDGGRSWTAPTVRWFSAQGRQLGASLTWTAQQPKRCPDEIFDHSTTIAFLHLDRRSANYLSGTLLLDTDLVDVLPQLAIGEFTLWCPGLEWNHRVYRF